MGNLLTIAKELKWLPYSNDPHSDDGEIGDWAKEYVKDIRNLVHPGKWLREYKDTHKITKQHYTDIKFIVDTSIEHLEYKVHTSLRKTIEKVEKKTNAK